VAIAGGRLRNLDHEELWVAFLNKSNTVLSFEMIFKGSLDAVNISHRDIIARALSKGAVNIIVFHNHPSGCPTPGMLDIEQTRRLSKSCKLMEMLMLDHIIVSRDSYYSFADEVTTKFKDK
jgi:DNA repair protein RadC